MSTSPSTTKENNPTDHPDWFLQSLVSIVNKNPIDFGITLQVAGFLVSGNLIGGAKYFEGFASDFASFLKDDAEAAETVKKVFTEQGSSIYKTEGDEAEDSPPPTFIHLKNARFFNTSGNPIPGNRGVWWRGRISEVSGFILGTLSPA